MKIYAPVKNTNGIYASVRFVNGVGETNDPWLIEWFKQHGYKVVSEDFNSVIDDGNYVIHDGNDEVDDETPDFDAMTPLELREWMRSNGYGAKIKNTRNKEKLLEILRG